MEVQRGGVGRVPLKSTGHSAPLREGPQYCRPQNQWAPDHEVQKWEQEISDIFQEGKEHKFEEAEILEDSKDFPTHSGIQTPVLNAAMGKTEGKEHKFEEAEILEDSKDFPTHSGIQTPVLNAAMGKTDAAAHPESKLQPMERSTNAQNFLAQGPTQTPDIQPEINKEPTEVSSIKKEIIASDKEFPPLNADLSEQDRPQEIAGEKEIFGRSRQSEQTNVEMPRHGVPLETFIEHGNEGKVPQNIEGKTAQHRDETAPDSGVHVGRALKKEITKPQSDHKFDEANILEDSKQFPAKEHEPDLSVPEETDKEKKEMKEVKGVVGEVKHVAQVVGSKIAHGVENVKEMLTDAVHHLTNTTEAEDKEKDEKEDKKEQTAGVGTSFHSLF